MWLADGFLLITSAISGSRMMTSSNTANRMLLSGLYWRYNVLNGFGDRSIQIHIVKAIVFPVVMCGCESWTIKKAECRRPYVFKLWCWRRLLRVPWTARRSNQPILKEINPEYSLKGLMIKLKLSYFGHVTRKADSLEKTWMLGKIEGEKRRGQQRMRWLVGWHHWLDGHELEQALGDGKGQGSLVCCNPKGCKELVYDWVNEQEPPPKPADDSLGTVFKFWDSTHYNVPGVRGAFFLNWEECGGKWQSQNFSLG